MQKKRYRELINNTVARLSMVETPPWPPGFLEEKCKNPALALDYIRAIDNRSQQNARDLEDVLIKYQTLLDKETQLEKVIQQDRKRHEQRRLDLI